MIRENDFIDKLIECVRDFTDKFAALEALSRVK